MIKAPEEPRDTLVFDTVIAEAPGITCVEPMLNPVTAGVNTWSPMLIGGAGAAARAGAVGEVGSVVDDEPTTRAPDSPREIGVLEIVTAGLPEIGRAHV